MSTTTTGKPRVVLGLCSFTHDSAAALLVDGHLTGFVEEERLCGVKHTREFPRLGIDWLLERACLDAGDVDVVAYNFQGPRYLGALAQVPGHLLDAGTRGRALARARSFTTVYRRHRARMARLAALFPNARIHPVLHHRAHGLYAFAASGYERAGVLVVDSLGETTTTAWGLGTRDATALAYKALRRIEDPASMGYVYGAVTEHLGWRRGDEEGTVMALAALGDPARFRTLFTEAVRLTPTGFALDPRLFALRVLSSRHSRLAPGFAQATCPARTGGEPVEQVHTDLAAALQERTEQVMLHLARRVREETGARLLCMGGGVATNCVAVGAVVNAGIFDEVFVPPAPGDAGTAIGAAVAAVLGTGAGLDAAALAGCYLGPQFPDVHVEACPRPGLTAQRVEDPARHLAEQLAAGKIVGCFRGRLEAGPRALGHRSILASPLLGDVVDRLNSTVKFREPFRPFAPVVLAEQAHRYFTLPQGAPYMSIASGVTDLARSQIPAVVHRNDTARVQTLTADDEPFLAKVLTLFEKHTGVPVLINTSLNVKGKPICGTPDMALDCLAGSGLDALLLQDWWVSK